MADEEQLQLILQAGISEWNKWRTDNCAITPDLSHANFIGANLIGANHIRADLSEADLSGAHLRETNLVAAESVFIPIVHIKHPVHVVYNARSFELH
jgi:hypothetical protein